MNSSLKLTLFFLGTFLATIALMTVLLEFSRTLGIRGNNNTDKRWSKSIKPSLGGIAIFLSVFISLITYLISHPFENVFSDSSFVYFFVGMCLAFFMGLSDDAFDTKPLIKLTAQIFCGLLIGFSKKLIPVSEVESINLMVTVLWTVGVMNSLNMLDNMDGIAASIATSALINFICISLFFCNHVSDIYIFLLIGFIGATASFLTFNKPPSKLFMGDSGSQLIGYVLAYFSVFILWDEKGISEIPFWVGTLILMMILAMPFIDTFTVVYNRVKRGASPARGGKDHTTHHLVYSGYSEFQVWLIFTAFSFTLGGLGLGMLCLYSAGAGYWILALFFPLIIAFYYFFRRTHVFTPPASKSSSDTNS